jgi:spore germination cell wall hydrolase CwlJ-like protein
MNFLVKMWLAIAVALVLMVYVHPARADAMDCLADNIYYEAASEPLAGKQAVALVTMNRAVQDFNGDICAAVYFKARGPNGKLAAAFSWTLGRAWRPKRVDPGVYLQCLEVAHAAASGTLPPVVGPNVKFYHADYVSPAWAKPRYRVARIGRHIFYRSAS